MIEGAGGDDLSKTIFLYGLRCFYSEYAFFTQHITEKVFFADSVRLFFKKRADLFTEA